MWRIFEHEDLDKVVLKLPKEILRKYEKWKDIITFSGVDGIREVRGFREEKLKGIWQGYRSSRLNVQYRVIYKVDFKSYLVKVVKITPHDYRG